jgi:hypothetical protein
VEWHPEPGVGGGGGVMSRITPLEGEVLRMLMQHVLRGEAATVVVCKGYDRVHDRVQWLQRYKDSGCLTHLMRVSSSGACAYLRAPAISFFGALAENRILGTDWPLDWPAMARALAFTHDTDPRAVLKLLERWLIPPVVLMCLEYVTGRWPTLDMQLEAAEPPPPPPPLPCPSDERSSSSSSLPSRKKPRIAIT